MGSRLRGNDTPSAPASVRPFQLKVVTLGTHIFSAISLSSGLPIARPALQMGDGDNDDLARQQTIYNLIWKSLHENTPGLLIGRSRCANLGVSLDAISRLGDGVEEFGAKSRTLLLIPLNSRSKFLPRGSDVADGAYHRPRTWLAIRRLTSFQDSNGSVPASSAFTRRSISAAQACSAPGSGGPSRLASSSDAISARAFTSSRRASARTASVVLVMV